MNPNRSIKMRQRLAKHVERATVPERPHMGPGPRYIVQPSVTAACAPSLRAIAAALRDEAHPIDDAGINAVARWLKDGCGPFFGRDSRAALQEVTRLQHVIVGADTSVFDDERLALAV